MNKTLFITNRFGERLEALYRKPRKSGLFPAVLFVSGFGADLHETNNSFDEISKLLTEHGFATLQFSFAGKGKSEGNYLDMTLIRQAKQVEDMLLWLRKRKDIDVSRIGILALSFGVPSTLALSLTEVRSLCLLSGVYFPENYMYKAFNVSGEYNPSGISFRKHTDGTISRVGPEFWKVIKSLNPQKIYKAIKIPVFVIHGDMDLKVNSEQTRKAFDLFSSETKRYKIFHGGDHGITCVPREMREELLVDIVKWFKDTL